MHVIKNCHFSYDLRGLCKFWHTEIILQLKKKELNYDIVYIVYTCACEFTCSSTLIYYAHFYVEYKMLL